MSESDCAPARMSDEELMYSPLPPRGFSLWVKRSLSFFKGLLAVTLILALALVLFFLWYLFVYLKAAAGK